MGKNKKKQEKGAASAPAATQSPAADQEASCPQALPVAGRESPDSQAPLPDSRGRAEAAAEPDAPAAAPRSPGRLRRWLPDLIKVGAALAVIGIAAAIWYKPPLTLADFPYVSYQFQGQTLADAQLFRPLAMPTRYYIRLPKKLADRYEWFAVDRRREVVALALAPSHRFLGHDAIKRSEPLGLDLEFRKLDHTEWQVFFLKDAVVFSNAVLAVRMDTKRVPNDVR
jgi:hypothetical protein